MTESRHKNTVCIVNSAERDVPMCGIAGFIGWCRADYFVPLWSAAPRVSGFFGGGCCQQREEIIIALPAGRHDSSPSLLLPKFAPCCFGGEKFYHFCLGPLVLWIPLLILSRQHDIRLFQRLHRKHLFQIKRINASLRRLTDRDFTAMLLTKFTKAKFCNMIWFMCKREPFI